MFQKLKETNATKLKEFEKELSLIQNPKVRNVVEIAICYIHPLFFQVEASATGKYHPAYALGNRGLLRHTRAAVYFANVLKTINTMSLSDYEYDICMASLIVHDSCKRGVHFDNPNTAHEHPLLVSYLVPNNTFFNEDKVIWDNICEAVSTHMGQWTTSNYSTVVLPKPQSSLQKFVSECDYLASRRSVDLLDIWNDDDLKIIEANKVALAESEKNKEPKLTEAQEKYIRSLLAEYTDTCAKLKIEVPKRYQYSKFDFLTKSSAGGFIAGLKKDLEKNKATIASAP